MFIIIENGECAIQAWGSEIEVAGCILRNCLQMGLKISRGGGSKGVARVRDCIFATSACGVYFIPQADPGPDSELYLEGNVMFYNWSTVDQLRQTLDIGKLFDKFGVSFAEGEVFKQLANVVSKNKDYAIDYTKNGKTETYYNFCVISFSASFTIGNKSYEFNASAKIDRSKLTLAYSDYKLSGALNLVMVVPFEIYGVSIPAANAFIKPGDTYVGNSKILSQIVQPNRIKQN